MTGHRWLWFALVLVMRAAPCAAQAAPDSLAPRPDSARGKLLFFPFLFYQPETRLGGGVALMKTYRAQGSRRTSAHNVMLVATARKQFSATFSFERYSALERWRHAGDIGWSRFPNTFFGVGNHTREADKENYTLESRRLFADARRAVGRGYFLGGSILMQRSRMRDADAGGRIASGTVSGSGGATLIGAGVTMMQDTRNHLFTPSRGGLATLTVRPSLTALGATHRYTALELDARDYRPIAGGVLAIQALMTYISGDPPFFDMAVLGGSNLLRGYYEGRFRDKGRYAFQFEYRRPVWKRVGIAVFTGAGQVSRDFGRFRPAELHASGGLGIRVRVSDADRVNARVDFGWGRKSSGLYFGFGEAF